MKYKYLEIERVRLNNAKKKDVKQRINDGVLLTCLDRGCPEKIGS